MSRKFDNECGASINEFGGVVIDEISFIDTPIFGHVDRAFSILLESTDLNTLCGGIPMLLAGDNQTLLVRRDALLVPDHQLDILNIVR